MAVADADTFFQVEMPALEQWSFTAEMAQRIKVPVLSVVGADTTPPFRESHAILRQWIPQTDELVVPAANHALQMIDPRSVAEGLASFYSRHRR